MGLWGRQKIASNYFYIKDIEKTSRSKELLQAKVLSRNTSFKRLKGVQLYYTYILGLTGYIFE